MWGRPIIARIVLRIALDREPTPAEVNDQVEKIEENNAELPSLNAIMAAFEKGEEVCSISSHSSPHHSLLCAADCLSMGTRMQGLRREPPVGDCCHVPIFQKGLSEEIQRIHLILCIRRIACH